MRRIRYLVAASLDGFIAGPRGEIDWIRSDPDIDFGELFSQFDTLLMGRNTYEAANAEGSPGLGMFGGKELVVFSRTLRQADHPRVAIFGEDFAEKLASLRERPGKDIWLFGGGALFRSLVDAGFVDTAEVAVIPVMIGEGIPLLAPPSARVRLTLTGHRIYEKTGIVSLEYDVGADPGTTAS